MRPARPSFARRSGSPSLDRLRSEHQSHLLRQVRQRVDDHVVAPAGVQARDAAQHQLVVVNAPFAAIALARGHIEGHLIPIYDVVDHDAPLRCHADVDQ